MFIVLPVCTVPTDVITNINILLRTTLWLNVYNVNKDVYNVYNESS